jgi:hypothetical protein
MGIMKVDTCYVIVDMFMVIRQILKTFLEHLKKIETR